MASIGHVVVGLAAARLQPRRGALTWVAFALFWSGLSLLPDLDVIGRAYGIRYGHVFGHRGASHSLAFCLALAALIGWTARAFGRSGWRTGLIAALVLVSHPLLDMMTDGGLGCAFLWPFDSTRYFLPWRPIPVAPLGRAFLSSSGLRVASIELVLFAPLWLFAFLPRSPNRL